MQSQGCVKGFSVWKFQGKSSKVKGLELEVEGVGSIVWR